MDKKSNFVENKHLGFVSKILNIVPSYPMMRPFKRSRWPEPRGYFYSRAGRNEALAKKKNLKWMTRRNSDGIRDAQTNSAIGSTPGIFFFRAREFFGGKTREKSDKGVRAMSSISSRWRKIADSWQLTVGPGSVCRERKTVAFSLIRTVWFTCDSTRWQWLYARKVSAGFIFDIEFLRHTSEFYILLID